MAVTRKLKLIALAVLVAAFSSGVTAEQFGIAWNPRSGDAWMDNQLDDVNRYGARYREPFVDEMVRHYGAPRALVNELLVTRRWAPGDVYYACAIAQALGRPCRYVVDEWQRDHGKGWGEVAEALGIKAGSAEFHRLKRGLVPTYDRWARPIRIDHDLRADFPGRGNGVQGKTSGPPGTSAGNDPGNDAWARNPGANANDKPEGKSKNKDGSGTSPPRGEDGKPQGKAGKG